MPLSNILPPDKQALIQRLTTALQSIPGVAAIVLGGSYARGTQHAESDLDIGLYYSEQQPFSIASIRDAASQVAIITPVVTDFYEWGPWVNGGAWIQTEAGKVDFLYRHLEQVERTILEAQQGIWHHDFNQQPTFGFYSVIYLAETSICLPLYDPAGKVAQLKKRVAKYPPALKQRIVADSLWGAEFALLFARKFASAGDVYNAVGCFTRIAGYLTQATFALNETYFISDKGALDAVGQFNVRPRDYKKRMEAALAHPGDSSESLGCSVTRLQSLWRDLVEEADDLYQPRFTIA